MSEEVFATVDRLFGVLSYIENCLQCTICLHTISDPVKTNCGHRFCRGCIQPVITQKKASCPLCNNAIHRRTVTDDENMKVYIENLRDLTEAIQKDTGIDLSSHSIKPTNTRESHSSEATECNNSDIERNVKRRWSDIQKKPLKTLGKSQSRRKQTVRNKKTKVRERSRTGTSATADIKKYLTNCGLSGIETLPPDELTVYQEDNSTDDRIQNWLETLPGNEQFDDLDKVAPSTSAGCNLDDTLIISVSQNRSKTEKPVDVNESTNKPESTLNDTPKENRRIHSERRLSKTSSHNQDIVNTQSKQEKSCGETKPKQTHMDVYNFGEPVPSTSGITKQNNANKERRLSSENTHLEGTNDVYRTSPVNMLPTMKKNWSSVVKFGREMRTKKKKLKSLNVSIENRKRRSLAEAAKDVDKNELQQGTSSGREENENNIPASIMRVGVDKHRLREDESLPNIENTRAVVENKPENYEEEASPKNRGNRSMSPGAQPPESPFIILEKGEQVHIRNLNTDQMNAIIGVSSTVENQQSATRSEDDQNGEWYTLPSKKQRNLSRSPPREQSTNFLEATPIKQATEQWSCKSNELNDNGKSQSLSGTKETRTEVNSAIKFLSPEGNSTPQRNRLSLKRRSTDRKSNQSSSPNADSRLFIVKRDLNQEIDGSGKDAIEVNIRSRRTEDLTAPILRPVEDKIHRQSVNDSANKRNENRERGVAMVTFKKLGKVCKQRRSIIPFYYLGSTKPRVRNTCNLNRQQNVQDSVEGRTNENSFGKNTVITVNYTPIGNEAECNSSQKNPRNQMETEGSSKVTTVSVVEKKSLDPVPRESSCNEEKSTNGVISSGTNKAASKLEDTNDVLFVSIYENEENERNFPGSNRQIERGSVKSVSEKTVSKTAIRMLSPKKDSQLKFLTIDSPTIGDSPRASKSIRQNEIVEDCSPKESSFPGIKGVHSRALMRTSWRASESSQIDSSGSSIRKRKRSISREKLSRRMKRISSNENEDNEDLAKSATDSNHSSSPKARLIRSPDAAEKETTSQVKGCDEKRYTLSTNCALTRDIATISTNSTVQPTNDEARTRESKKVYRRIISLVSSDTDSPDIIFESEQHRNTPPFRDAISSPFKRKRIASSDSDDELKADAIVNCWSKDLNPAETLKKKGKVGQPCGSSNPTNTSRETRNDVSLKLHQSSSVNLTSKLYGLQRGRPCGSDIWPVIEKSKPATMRSYDNLDSKDLFDKDSPDFHSTLDKVRNMQNAAAIKDTGRSGDQVGNHITQDNFDEIIANFDTEALLDQCTETTGTHERNDRKRLAQNDYSRLSDLAKPSHSRLSNKSTSPSKNSDNSNKENSYMDQLRNSIIDNARSSIANNASVAEKSSKKERLQNNKSCEGMQHVSTDKDKTMTNENVNNLTSKEMYEQDSLMNITQHYLLIRQFEEDLFGRPLNFGKPDKKEVVSEERTPPKQANAGHSKTREEDTQHSPEEDDIVENTPEAKTKNIQRMNSRESNRMSVGSSIINFGGSHCSPSSVHEKCSNASTPFSRKNLRPLYESTPKAQHSFRRSIHNAAMSMESKKSKITRNTIEPFGGHVKDVVGRSGQNSVARKLCFVCSSLVASQIEQVKRLAQLVNATYVTQFSYDVTHVIVKVNKENNGANKTLKYLQGIAHRKWIVSYQWIVESLNEKKLVDEEPYEAVDSTTLEAGPRKSRLREKHLFEGFTFLCIGPYVDVLVEQYQDLLRSNGAIVVDSLDALAAVRRRLKVIVIQADDYDYEIIAWYKKAGAVAIVHDWVVECISQYKLISLYLYLQELSREDVLALGFPEFLLEGEADEDSDNICD